MRIMLQKTIHWALCLAILLAASSETLAQKKGGKGGGGNQDPPPEPPVYYNITLIPTIGTGPQIQGSNQNGDFVGYYNNSDNDLRPFLYTDNLGMIDLNELLPESSPWTLRVAKAINNHGTIVGAGRLPGDTVSRACRLTQNTDGTVTVDDLGRLHPDDYLITNGINDFGEITGLCYAHDGSRFIWYYSDATGLKSVDLGMTTNQLYQPAGINNLGQIIGKFANESSTVYRVVPGLTPDYYPSPIGGPYYLNGFNDLGEFVGKTTFPGKGKNTYWAAFQHNGSSFFEVTSDGVSPTAYDTNNKGDVIGMWTNKLRYVDENAKQTFVYLKKSQTIFELDTAVLGTETELSLWFGATPIVQKINDAGEIIGFINQDSTNTLSFFKLTPTEAP